MESEHKTKAIRLFLFYSITCGGGGEWGDVYIFPIRNPEGKMLLDYISVTKSWRKESAWLDLGLGGRMILKRILKTMIRRGNVFICLRIGTSSELWYIRQWNISSIKAASFLTTWGANDISRRAVLRGFDICRNNVRQAIIPATNYNFLLQQYYKTFIKYNMKLKFALAKTRVTWLYGNLPHVYNDKVISNNTAAVAALLPLHGGAYFKLQGFHLIRPCSPASTLSC